MAFGTTVDALCERVRRDALLSLVGPLYTLRTAYTAGGTTLEVAETPEHMSQGSTVAIDAELFYVKSVNSGSMILNVIPGYYGTTTANHAEDSIIEVDPRVPKAALVDWAEQEIRSWSKQLFRIVTLSLDIDVNERTYDLAGVDAMGVDFLLDVRSEPLSSVFDDYRFGITWSRDAWPRVASKLLRDMPVSEFPSGYALQLDSPPRHATTLRVAYAAPFDLSPFTLTTDLISDVGLETNFLEVLELGMRMRALSSGLVARTDWRAQGQSRDAEEVTLIDIVRAVDMARSQRMERLAEMALTLRARYPYLMR